MNDITKNEALENETVVEETEITSVQTEPVKTEVQPTEPTETKLNEVDQKVAEYIGVCVSQFTAEMKKKVNALGYVVDFKVNVLFGKPEV